MITLFYSLLTNPQDYSEVELYRHNRMDHFLVLAASIALPCLIFAICIGSGFSMMSASWIAAIAGLVAMFAFAKANTALSGYAGMRLLKQRLAG